MLKTKMRKWCLLLLLLGCSMGVQAQYSMGNTGLLNIPTADMQETGTFMGGGNYLPNGMTPFNFNTGNYFVNITFLSFLELSYRCTLQKAKRYDGKEGYFHQDRSMTARVRPLKEGKFHPSLLLGVDDPFKNTGINYFATVYGALTKGFSIAKGDRLALETFHEAGACLGRLCATATTMLNLEKAVIGGGVAVYDFNLLKPGLDETLPKLIFKTGNESFFVEKTALGYNASLLGAAALTLRDRERWDK